MYTARLSGAILSKAGGQWASYQTTEIDKPQFDPPDGFLPLSFFPWKFCLDDGGQAFPANALL